MVVRKRFGEVSICRNFCGVYEIGRYVVNPGDPELILSRHAFAVSRYTWAIFSELLTVALSGGHVCKCSVVVFASSCYALWLNMDIDLEILMF
jgi:hypothetical protein